MKIYYIERCRFYIHFPDEPTEQEIMEEIGRGETDFYCYDREWDTILKTTDFNEAVAEYEKYNPIDISLWSSAVYKYNYEVVLYQMTIEEEEEEEE
jgi:hypothetical protein